MEKLIKSQPIIAGDAEGELVISDQPLSFWGGYDQSSGEIIDRRHPLSGVVAKGRILGIPNHRGSSTTTAVLLEAVRQGTAPAALLTTGTDTFFALASIVAEEMYGIPIPVYALSEADFMSLSMGEWLEIHGDGTIRVNRSRNRGADGGPARHDRGKGRV